MTGWMKRRIARSRARCDKPTTNNKNLKERGADKQPKLSAPLQNNEKGG